MELLLLSLCRFICKGSLLFRVEMNPVWMAKDLTNHIFHSMYQFAFFLFTLKKTNAQNMWFNFTFKPVEITGYLLFMKALFSLKRKE